MSASDFSYERKSACSVSTICSALPAKIDVTDFPHLANLEFAEEFESDGRETPIDILIGQDLYYQIVSAERIEGDTGPVAIGSIFGYLLCGPVECSQSNGLLFKSNLIITGQDDKTLFEEHSDDLRQTLKQFWEVENVSTKGPFEAESKPEGILRGLTFSNKRYQVKLPWIDHTNLPPLADNYELYKSRLNSLLFRLNKEPNLLNGYDKIICDQL